MKEYYANSIRLYRGSLRNFCPMTTIKVAHPCTPNCLTSFRVLVELSLIKLSQNGEDLFIHLCHMIM